MHVIFISTVARLYQGPPKYLELDAVALAQQVVKASDGAIRVTVLDCGAEPSATEPTPGVTVRRLPAWNTWAPAANHISCEMDGIFADADLIHIQCVNNRFAELALLLVSQMRLPVVINFPGDNFMSLATQLNLFALADRIVCHSMPAGNTFPAECLLICNSTDVSDIAATFVQGYASATTLQAMS